MSVSVEYVTYMKRIHTTGEGQVLSCALAYTLNNRSTKMYLKRYKPLLHQVYLFERYTILCPSVPINFCTLANCAPSMTKMYLQIIKQKGTIVYLILLPPCDMLFWTLKRQICTTISLPFIAIYLLFHTI